MSQYANSGAARETAYRAMSIGVLLVVLTLSGSCLAAPFLFPLFQVFLLIPMLPAAVFGLIGARRRSWRLTLGLTFAALALYILHDVLTNPFGYAAIFDLYIRNQPPAGLMYFHSWWHLFDMVILVLCPSVAIIAHALVELRRFAKREVLSRAGRCETCGYPLRGLPGPCCPECGNPFDPARAAELSVFDER